MRVRHAGGVRRRRSAALAVATALAAGFALTALGCGSKSVVCLGKPAHVAVIASTSKTDYDLSVELAPEVAQRAVRHAARSCGEMMVGIQDGRPDANLDLIQKRFEPRIKEAFDPSKVREELFEEGDEFVADELIRPLGETKAIGGSPFFASVAKTRREADVRGWPPVTVVLIGDGFVVERAPESGEMVSFGREPVSDRTLAEFTALLGDLRGSCVMVVGFGAGTGLRGEKIRETEALLARAFEAAGASFVASRSPNIEPECPAQ